MGSGNKSNLEMLFNSVGSDGPGMTVQAVFVARGELHLSCIWFEQKLLTTKLEANQLI
jgi:hypothetical protein